VYNKADNRLVGHGDFVVCWPTSVDPTRQDANADLVAAATLDDDAYDSGSDDEAGRGGGWPERLQQKLLLRQLPPYNRDLCLIVAGAVDVDFLRGGGEAAQGARQKAQGHAAGVQAGEAAVGAGSS
jgi:hypothetical protein